jgi:hypothetical protein
MGLSCTAVRKTWINFLQQWSWISPAAISKQPSLTSSGKLAASEDRWRARTYLFSIGSAILTAVVALAVAWIAKPSHTGPTIHVDEVHTCRDSLQRLSTLTQLQNQTVTGLSTAINSHVSTCDSVLEGIILATAKQDSK